VNKIEEAISNVYKKLSSMSTEDLRKEVAKHRDEPLASMLVDLGVVDLLVHKLENGKDSQNGR